MIKNVKNKFLKLEKVSKIIKKALNGNFLSKIYQK